jgi:hypothetical protein
MLEEYETTMEAAKRLGRHPSYICHLAREGRLRARKFDCQWHVERGAEPDEELEAYAPLPWCYRPTLSSFLGAAGVQPVSQG